MRIAMVNLTSGGLSGGYAKYLKHIVPLLRADARVDILNVYLPEAALAFTTIDSPNIYTWSQGNRRGVFRAIADSKPDVVFIPTARWYDFGSIPIVAMVRNMEPLVNPVLNNSVVDALRNLARRSVARSTCNRADRIIAVSNFVREYLEEEWHIDRKRIAVVYHGVEEPLHESAACRPPRLTSMDSNRPLVFTAGSIRPARGLGDLIGASRLLLDKGRPFQTLIAGAPTGGSEHYQKALMADTKSARLESHVTWLGNLAVEEMAWCYQHCDVFVMNTRAEACPNTALEAMSYGTLIVSADTKPLPEFFGNAALYYQAGNKESLATQLAIALNLPRQRRDALRGAARLRGQQFRWGDTARRTVDELIKCVRNSRYASSLQSNPR